MKPTIFKPDLISASLRLNASKASRLYIGETAWVTLLTLLQGLVGGPITAKDLTTLPSCYLLSTSVSVCCTVGEKTTKIWYI